MLWHLKYPYLAPDDGLGGSAGGGGIAADPANPPAPPPGADDIPVGGSPKHSDKDMAAMRRKHERELKIRDKAFAEQEARLSALENPAPADPPPSGDPADKNAGELELMQKRHAREMEAARNDAAEARKIAESERLKRRNVERDRSLESALTLAGVADKAKVYAKDHFEKKIIWDDVDGQWVYKTKLGNLVEIADGVSEEMPDMFKRPAATRGGAGTQTGLPPTRARISAQLQIEQQKLAQIKALGGKQNSNVLAFTKQLRLVQQLEAQVSAT